MKKILAAAIVANIIVGPAFAEGSFTVTSPDISEGVALLNKHVLNGFGCKGENISPALEWSNAPEGTKSFVVTAYDPDAPTGSGWWHWVVFNIPANISKLPQNAGSGTGMPKEAIQSRTDFGTVGFGGACPPPGEVHRYEFRIHALSVDNLKLDKDASPALVGFMAGASTLGTAKLTTVYTR